MLDTSSERYQDLVKELRNCIINENLKISKEGRNGLNYRYYSQIDIQDNRIFMMITLSGYLDSISIRLRFHSVPKDRVDAVIRLVNYINKSIYSQHFFVCYNEPYKSQAVFLATGFSLVDSRFDERLFHETFARVFECSIAYGYLITDVIESGNLEEVLCQYENELKKIKL